MSKRRDTATVRTSKNVERNLRIAQLLVAVVRELYPQEGPRALLMLVRGVALHVQTQRLAPAAFDCANGRDALAALATIPSRDQLTTVSNGNAFVLNARWSKVVYVAGLELPGPALGAVERNRAADIPTFETGSYPPKIFGRFMT